MKLAEVLLNMVAAPQPGWEDRGERAHPNGKGMGMPEYEDTQGRKFEIAAHVAAERGKIVMIENSFVGEDAILKMDPDEALEIAGFAMDRTTDGLLTPEQQTEVIAYLANVIEVMQGK